MSEYTQRYEPVSHKELYQGITAGDPKQIDGLSAQWSSLKDTLDGLGRDLAKDLDALAKTWSGDAAREFHQRLNLVVDYSGNLAEGMAGIKQALGMMATELRTAQSKAESPEETDDNDKLVDGAVKGFLMGGAAGAVIGGFVGHKQDEAEQEKAHQRMVQVVANLAEGYDFSAYGRIVVPDEPDDRLPGQTDKTGPTLGNGPSVGTPSAGPTSGTFGSTSTATATTSGVHHTGPTSGTVGTGPGTTTGTGGPGTIGSIGVTDPAGTSLAGAAPPLTSPGPTTGLTGLSSASSTVPTSGGNSFFGVPGVGTGSLAGSTGGVSGRPGGLENRSAAGTGRLAGGRGAVVDAEGRSNGGKGAGARSAMPGRNGVLGKHGQRDEDETDEHLTWLTEDEMVWGDGRSAPPSVLGTD
ncbi:WXG100 family type VII secretion target [Micromonospora yasonensis]|uniref:WXG100 family type VII secretion target n=1 Tax=Micromonospora yasonensis TaxID=1128667 RepID=UPI002231924A|nr:WXG100 family type VII secretion target [Micromonospora yasonensis]MCW3839952.1 WXG100 family type VII secretion target [Micromonospora yasonensis]